MVDLPIDTVAILVAAAFAAGFVDALAGGGGLIQLPALLLWLPGATPLQVLATNKFSSICGTSVSAATYYRRIRPDPATFGPLMVAAAFGAAMGAAIHYLRVPWPLKYMKPRLFCAAARPCSAARRHQNSAC